ncbi:Kelch repeat containing f-box protein-like [Thalictrum thalictroides]|uniref:Kelch repeat containing f-box protein-like n=1 Tax=Thalictrum thalictroides TaxID=46969 RepID=A0A7J6X9M6_THATH|nr:Kelch repeat containing f-box protein-like [Thalictrum thalictroides]
MRINSSSTAEKFDTNQELIPGLPDEIAESCLLYLPYPYPSLVRSVSSSWNRAINDPAFLLSKKTLSISLPYIFVFAFQKSTTKLQWQAFDPRSSRWFILPPMPYQNPVCPAAFSCSSLPKQGKLFVLGGMRSDTETPLQSLITYSTATNKWSIGCSMLTPRSYFASGSIGSKIFAAGGNGVGHEDTISSMECYDPITDTWTPVAKMIFGLARYDTAVIGTKFYVTEGWTWPFSFSPRGEVYDSVNNKWEEMSLGMREGWTGVSVVLDDRLFVISEHGDCRVKFYVPDNDTWQYVEGKGFPCGVVQRPFSVSAMEGKIYVVSCGLNVAIGNVYEEKRLLRVEWKVVEAPKAFGNFVPSSSQVVYG